METVLLCDDAGTILKAADRREAHSGTGLLHRAFSVFVFRNSGQELLIQKRSQKKMLFPLLWANTCCSHLKEGETIREAGEQRLKDEFGFSCPLAEGPSFVYRAEDPGKRGTEYEYDTILVGNLMEDAPLAANPEEISEWKWVSLERLKENMRRAPLEYAPWFYLALAMILRKPQ